MPKLFDVFMAKHLSRILTYYQHDRELRILKDVALTKLKVMEVGKELETCRKIITGDISIGSLQQWQEHLGKFESDCKDIVTRFNTENSTKNPEGKLVNNYIDEAKRLLEHSHALFVLFGLEDADALSLGSDFQSRSLLLELCISRLYIPNAMSPAEWTTLSNFQTEMKEYCKVAEKKSEGSKLIFNDKQSLQRATDMALSKQEDLLKKGSFTIVEQVASAAVHAGTYIVSKMYDAASGLSHLAFGSSPSAPSSSASSSSMSSKTMLTASPTVQRYPAPSPANLPQDNDNDNDNDDEDHDDDDNDFDNDNHSQSSRHSNKH
jgi:hypothetical protein